MFFSNYTFKSYQSYLSLLCFLTSFHLFANPIVKDTIPTPKFIKNARKVFTSKDSIIAAEKIKPVIKKISEKKKDSIETIIKESIRTNYWIIKHKPGILFTQTSFVNWTKGGNNTIAGIASFKGDYNYKKGQLFWRNGILIRYGIAKENGVNYTQKTDDIIDIKSSVGYKNNVTSKWYYSGEYSLTTQFANGFKGNDRTTVISTFFAPARMRLGIGAVYTDEEDNFKIHLSPLTNQITFVLDKELSDRGAFGVERGEKINFELGTLIKIEYKTLLMKNIDFSIKSSFYSDYINRYGNIDSDIELNLEMKVNQYIQSRISSHFLYDDDAKIVQDDGTQVGPRPQLKQILGVGVTYTF
ncbi:DUF3078 domain-containing protein [Wenyingzhuangia sp. IMCC45533]